jgi:hypothetical protein
MMFNLSLTPFSTMTMHVSWKRWFTDRKEQLTMRFSVNLGRLSWRDIGLGPSLRLDQMGCEESVDHRRLSESSLS